MTSPSRLLSVVLLVLGLGLGALPALAAPADARRVTVTLSPAQPMAGERTRFSGRAGGKGTRVVLERRKGRAWVAVARSRAGKGGRYAVSTRIRKPGSYRIRAAGGARRVRVRLAPQTAALSMTAPLVSGIARTVTATVTPARPGRVVRLQRLTGGAWSTVATAATDGGGVARIGHPGGAAGTTTYRVLGEGHRGSTSVASAPRTVRTAPVAEAASPGTAVGESSYDPAVSADGRWVAFTSESRLLPSDTDDLDDVYLLDRATGALTHPVSPATGHVVNPLLSADGRFLAFQSDSFDLAAEPGYDHDVFVLDRSTGAIDLVTSTPGGDPANRASDLYAISGDGRFVAFTSTASDLVTALPPPNTDVRHAYLHDRATGTTRALDRIGLGWSDVNIFGLDLSADGRRVAFASGDVDLDPGDVDGSAIFAWDVAPDGGLSHRTNLTPDVDADSPSLSGDGSDLVLTADEDIAAGDTNGARDTYLRTAAGNYVKVGPVGAAGTGSGEISADGRYVSLATKIELPGDTNGGTADIVVWERATGVSTLITRSGAGASGDDRLSADGSVLVFSSLAAVVPGTPGFRNVYVRVLR